MVVVANGKIAFSRDRIVSATQASKNFGECRRRAKEEPLFVTDRNAHVDTVIVDFDEFEAMSLELERLRLERFYATAADRLAEIDTDPEQATVSLSEALAEEELRDFLDLDIDETPDEMLFE